MTDTFDPKLDGERLGRQLDKVRELMLDGRWRTLDCISYHCSLRGWHFSTPSISARLRELRSKGYLVERRRRGEPKNGLWEYKVSRPEPRQLQLLGAA